MRRSLFDTNIWIRVLKRHAHDANLVRRWEDTVAEEIVTCAVVKAELWHGARKYSEPDRRRRVVDDMLAPYVSLAFDDAAAAEYARIRHALEAAHHPIGPNDLLIAAICLANDVTLVTGNLDEFQRVPGLRTEDWGAA